MPTPPLGWIEPAQRTREQIDAHAIALAAMPNFALPPVATAGPVKVMLTDFWKDPDVVADVGFEFNGFFQFTGSCVGVSAGNAIFTLTAVQRKIADAPQKAFVPFWPYAYGMTRYDEGDRGRGEGAVDSVMGQRLKKGNLDSRESGLPQFSRTGDGLQLSSSIEMAWSYGGDTSVSKWEPTANKLPLGTAAPLNNPQDIKTAILNGYPVLYGCSMYKGNGRVVSGGGTPYVRGVYDGRGGHSTCILGYWDHPSDGPLYLESNQWQTDTYAKDPAGAGRCCVWTPEREVQKVFTRYGGDGGETMALSHQTSFPVQVDKILDWSSI